MSTTSISNITQTDEPYALISLDGTQYAAIVHSPRTGPVARTYRSDDIDPRFVTEGTPLFDDHDEALRWMVQHPGLPAPVALSIARTMYDGEFADPA